ncbi:MAG: DUF4199 domain-containing protein [Bacteroidota bacterium]
MEQKETSEATPTLLSHALRWGAMLGIISIALTIIWYVVDYTLMADWKVGIFSLVIYIAFTAYAGINYRGEIGGYISFGKAFQHGFLVFAISGLLATFFTLLLYTVIDPELPAKLTEATLEKTAEMMEGFGAPQDAIDKAMDDARERSESQYSVTGSFTGYGFMLIMSAIFSLITGLVVRKNEPMEM